MPRRRDELRDDLASEYSELQLFCWLASHRRLVEQREETGARAVDCLTDACRVASLPRSRDERSGDGRAVEQQRDAVAARLCQRLTDGGLCGAERSVRAGAVVRREHHRRRRGVECRAPVCVFDRVDAQWDRHFAQPVDFCSPRGKVCVERCEAADRHCC